MTKFIIKVVLFINIKNIVSFNINSDHFIKILNLIFMFIFYLYYFYIRKIILFPKYY